MKDLLRRPCSPDGRRCRDDLWRVLCTSFFQRYVVPTGRLLDLGCGDCLFLKHIRCGEKTGLDRCEKSLRWAPPGARIVIREAGKLSCFDSEFFDTVFASNFFEHLEKRERMVDCLEGIHRILRCGGRLVILQPNIRVLGGRYWDFFDHRLPLTDRSMVEALEMTGFDVLEVRPRFLPYTIKGPICRSPLALRIYLKARLLHPLFGKQAFIVAERGRLRKEKKPGKAGGRARWKREY